MRKKGILTIAVSVWMSLSAYGMIEGPTEIAQLPLGVYAPVGFDNNDNSQVVYEVGLSNSCYKAGTHYVEVDHEAKKVFVTNTVFKYPSVFCSMIYTQYTKTVDLGILAKGNYEILFKNVSKGKGDDEASFLQLDSLSVDESKTEAADNKLYAPIDEVSYRKDLKQITLKGEFSKSCMRIKEVVAERPDSKMKNVIVVLPEAEEISPEDCVESGASKAFSYNVPVGELGEGRVLIHVRSLSGMSVNKVVDL